MGHRVAIRPADRIITLAPDVTELAFALGHGERVVAVQSRSDFPAAARGKPRVEANDLESILALEPDLVLATAAGNEPRTIGRLRDLGVRVLTVDVASCERLGAAVELLQTALGAPSHPLATDAPARCAAVARRGRALRPAGALYVVWWDPLVVAGPGTFHDDMLRHAGLVNLAPAGAGRYPRVDPELLLSPRLEVIVAPDEPEVRAAFSALAARPALARLTGGRLPVVWLDADLANRPGPRLPEAYERLVAAREALR